MNIVSNLWIFSLKDWLLILSCLLVAIALLHLVVDFFWTKEVSGKDCAKLLIVIILSVNYISVKYDNLEKKYSCNKVTCTRSINV